MAKALITHYPGSTVKITDPFFVMSCSCSYRQWSVSGDPAPCPKCGKMMEKEGESPRTGQS